MRLPFAGCGDAFGSGGRGNTCFHVRGERVDFLIDHGASSLPVLKRLDIARNDIDLILIIHLAGSEPVGGVHAALACARESGYPLTSATNATHRCARRK